MKILTILQAAALIGLTVYGASGADEHANQAPLCGPAEAACLTASADMEAERPEAPLPALREAGRPS
ncbi:hypothetical protein LR948_04255 [Roseivivax sp. GX 12232]|uniref:hypothetical protein n=1 Tax=Roseivivax sp. GX 12232 TaxID=2900547 RepID=UPI001E4FF843|nr:hypothetical protein [Roseivivax sp. GX 12232]MCE0504554.1 hypothetical protein [Roseivivax sp. GX 12232]